jgi:predicted GNAT family N-acyltransferase
MINYAYCLFEADSSVLRGLPNGLQKVLVRCRILQLNGLDATQIVEVTGPLVVASQLRENRLGHQLVCLVIQMVVQIVAQQTVDQHSLTFGVVAECGSTQASMQEAKFWICFLILYIF